MHDIKSGTWFVGFSESSLAVAILVAPSVRTLRRRNLDLARKTFVINLYCQQQCLLLTVGILLEQVTLGQDQRGTRCPSAEVPEPKPPWEISSE